MTITNKDRETLIKYRIEQAHEAIDEAELSINHNKLKMAINRIYYGMFYILSALALKHKFKTSKHKELIGWFNKNFIKDKIINLKYGEIIRKAFRRRSDGDYGAFVTFEKADVEKMFEDMKDFIATIEEHIKSKKSSDMVQNEKKEKKKSEK
ncbi:MAG: HEPN domain-containing protein [Candidatus Aminicenantes bacterium]|nr:HEPN domain-containing protein [Candidatus Aminicenantes bacterium]NIM78726.1 HEPN domain-containing protein [Candidatus Aminicenantes bacterium]NIN17974.1 HEPN domain-containing protein [Candidatus Aminicenantes bacterium]NIN41877.1 HEPN domain-containing protein [Candidatus Aminicenantes bacterium]NIN84629.1 HEPN domain-containing protein [Candidatus Aminicenantes bacterium]